VVCSCGKSKPARNDAGMTPRPDTGTATDVAGSEGGGMLSPCLERPNDLPRPPSGRLPCELLPPGFQ
jgi:hypothetical protein